MSLSDLDLAKRAASALPEFRLRLDALRRVLAAHPKLKLSQARIGEPGSAERLGAAIDEAIEAEDVSGIPPAEFEEVFLAFDGCCLKWGIKRRSKTAAAPSGLIHVASLDEVTTGDLAGLYEGGSSTQLFPSTDWASLEFIEEGSGLSMFGRDDSYFRASELPVLDALNRCVDLLGISGWELGLYENREYDDEDVEARREQCAAAAQQVWSLLDGGQ